MMSLTNLKPFFHSTQVCSENFFDRIFSNSKAFFTYSCHTRNALCFSVRNSHMLSCALTTPLLPISASSQCHFPSGTGLFAPMRLVWRTHSHLHMLWLGAFHGAMILGRGCGHLEMSWERSRPSSRPSSTGWFMRFYQMKYSKGLGEQAGPNRPPKGHLT